MNRWTKDTTIGAVACIVIAAIVGLLIWGIVAWFQSWPDPLTNDEIIRETKKCKDAGLYPTHYSNWSLDTVKIICENRNT